MPNPSKSIKGWCVFYHCDEMRENWKWPLREGNELVIMGASADAFTIWYSRAKALRAVDDRCAAGGLGGVKLTRRDFVIRRVEVSL